MAGRLARVGRHPATLLVFVVLGGVAFATRDQWDWLLADGNPQTTGAYAPAIEDLGDDERLYRMVTDDGSSLTYAVDESLGGTDGTAEGTTTAVAGDIAVNEVDPARSRMGQMVVNVELFESDSNLRDKRIRHDFLESTHHPNATFEATRIDGLPSSLDGEATAELTITGDLTLKETTGPVTFTGTATVTDDDLTATMTGTILMSDFDIGPIHVPGLAHTEDEVAFTLEVLARRTDPSEPPPTALASAGPAEIEFAEGEFASTVAPILESNCVSCHEEDSPGFTTVELDTAGKAAEIADDLALVTESRYMPPWPASDRGPVFDRDTSLSDDEVATIQAWAADGGGIDVDPDTALEAEEITTPEIDRDIELPTRAAYTGDPEIKDDYRCQIHEVDGSPELSDEDVWLQGYGFEPDQVEVVHHAIVVKVPAASRAAAEARDGADGRPGWTCFATDILPDAPFIQLGAWTPGQAPRSFTDGVGIKFEPGDFLVTQIHYHYDHEAPADRSTLVLDTLTEDEAASLDTPMTEIQGRNYITPAEGPCTPDEEGRLCDRDAVLDEVAGKYGITARFIPDALIRRCGGTVDDYDDLDGTQFSSSCDLPATQFGTIQSVLGHMHEFGARYRMTLNPDTPDEQVLLDIPTWSFEWQLLYEPTEDIVLEPGDVLRFECWWDRDNAPMVEPRYITWNEGTEDEMCFSTVNVIPHTDTEGNPNRFAG